MKNKLYLYLFVVTVSSGVTVFATGRDGQGTWWGGANTFSGGILNKSNLEDLSILGNKSMSKFNLGGNPSTYAPSQEENFLRRLAYELNGLNPEYAMKLQSIAYEIAQLRMHDLDVFNKYFVFNQRKVEE